MQKSRPDPNGIQEFLVNELHDAEALGQRAWIFGHVPPGAADALYDQVSPLPLVHNESGQIFFP